ncbi:MAG: hypothetical protein ACXVNN_10325, partial [Bacteroidia bacterium]
MPDTKPLFKILNIRFKLFIFLFLSVQFCLLSQNKDSSNAIKLQEIIITEYRTVNGVGHMPEVKDGII